MQDFVDYYKQQEIVPASEWALFMEALARYSLYLLYYYKSTNTDAATQAVTTHLPFLRAASSSGYQPAYPPPLRTGLPASVYLLYYYKSTNTDAAVDTNLHILRQCVQVYLPQFTCFTSTKVQILTQQWIPTCISSATAYRFTCLSLLALLVQKYKY
jgi:hypothetical protein